MKHGSLVLLALALVTVPVALGCGRSDGPAPVVRDTPSAPSTPSSPSAPARSGAPGVAAAGGAAEAPPNAAASPSDTALEPSPPAIDELAARRLVAEWERAQITRDHAAYSALYAARFEGVRRAGPRVRRFGRDGWLADRRNMFSFPLSVSTSDVVVSPAGQTTVVRFTQRFTAGRFEDVGPKEMVLVREGANVRIAREEMLASNVLASNAPVPSGTRGDFLPVVVEGGITYVVLSTHPEEGWGSGPISLVTHQRPLPQTIVTRRAAGAAPTAQVAWRGREVNLYSDAGQSCTARLTDLFLLSRVDVHFGTEQRWAGDEDGDGTPERQPATNGDIAADAYGQGLLLVATLREPGCTGAWARSADRPAPVIFARAAAPADVQARALAAYRAMPAWRALQTDYAADGNAVANGKWDEHQGQPEVEVWEDPASHRRFVSVTRTVSVAGCADFNGQLWALFEATGASLALRTTSTDPSYLEPESLIDTDGDGTPEVLTATGLARRSGTAFTITESTAEANLDCGC